MSIGELIGAVPPPAQPIDALDGGLWNSLEATLSIRLPADWRDFGLQYGSGEFGPYGGYTFWNPFAADTLMWINQIVDLHRWTKETDPKFSVPYDLHPARPGLLPWGMDVNGGTYWWLTDGQSDEWPVIFVDRDFYERPEKFEMPMTTFIKKLASGELPTVNQGQLVNVFTIGRNQSEVAARLIAGKGGA